MNKTKGLIFTASLVLAITFTISCEDKEAKDKFTDSRDGKTYKTVTIGSQTWMAENLNFAAEGSKCYGEGIVLIRDKENPGTFITKTLSPAEVQANCDKYGRMYNWETAMKACPSGWHLPNDNEWTELMKFLASNKEDVRYGEYEENGEKYYSNAGKYLKSKSGWEYESEYSSTDEFGFSGLPGGYNCSGNEFYDVGHFGRWWSNINNSDAPYWTLSAGTYTIDYNNYNTKSCLHSVRCIQDYANTSTAETAAPPTEAAEAPNIPDPEEGAFTDSRDGKKYKSLKIGEQVWMAENLNYKTKGGKCFGEGGKFTQEYYEDYPEEKTLSKAEVQANCTKYGRLYNWETAKKSCPKDWHLPSKEEWATLVNFVGGEKRIKKGNKYSFSSDAPCCGEADGRFVGESVSGGNWWSSSEPKGDGKNAYGWYIGYGMNYGLLYDIADSIYKDKSSLLYVRCVEDSEEYRAEAAAKNKALEDLIVKVIKANSNEDELNKLIIKDFGIAYFYAPGIMSYIYRFDKISYKDRESEYGPPYGLYCETDNYKIRFEKPRYSGCHDDDAKWNKPPGIYCDTTQTSDRLASTAKRTNELMGEKVWSAKQIKKFEEIEKENHEVIVIDKDGGACIFYVAFWQNKWYLIAIDQFDPCSA